MRVYIIVALTHGLFSFYILIYIFNLCICQVKYIVSQIFCFINVFFGKEKGLLHVAMIQNPYKNATELIPRSTAQMV